MVVMMVMMVMMMMMVMVMVMVMVVMMAMNHSNEISHMGIKLDVPSYCSYSIFSQADLAADRSCLSETRQVLQSASIQRYLGRPAVLPAIMSTNA